jgi:hypothetical protein
MPDRLSRMSRLDQRLGAIDRALVDVHRRLDAIEAGALRPAPGRGEVAMVEPPLAVRSVGRPELTSVVSLVGRTFVVLGGAYLLRALTESGRLPGRGGILLGLAYAVVWFGAADRAGVTRPLSGLFHGIAAVVISLPLLWEASAHFRLLSPAATAAMLVTIAGVAFFVAWHRHLQSLAGVAVMGSVVATTGLAVATGRPLAFAAALVAVGAGTLWLSDARGWWWLRWPAALVADLVALVLVARAAAGAPGESRGAAIALVVTLMAVYAVPVIWRALAANARVHPFEMIQTPGVIGLGLLGGMAVARGAPGPARLALAGLALVAAAACYAAFGTLRHRAAARTDVAFFGLLAVGLLLIGGAGLLDGPAVTAWCGVLAVAAAILAVRVDEPQLSLHAAVLGLAMAGVSGTLAWASSIWFSRGAWPPLSPAHLATLTVAAACVAIPARTSDLARRASLTTVARYALVVVFVAGAGGILVWWLGPRFAGDPLDAGALASITTIVLAASAVAAAALFRLTPWVEFGWLVYPVLAAGGLKLILDDFRYSSPATLFAALAVYGAALILAPRILRRS